MTDGAHDHPSVQAQLVALGERLTAAEAELGTVSARVTKLEGTPPPPPPPQTGTYGPAWNADTKSNLQVGWTDKARIAHQFTAEHDGTIAGIRVSLRGGPVYSGGTGGVIECTIRRALDGPAQGLAGLITPGNAGAWTTYPEFLPTATVTKGETLYAVFEDIDPSPTKNYCSLNETFLYGTSPLWQGQRQPRLPDAAWAVLSSVGGWHLLRETAVMEVRYSDGFRQGNGYVGMIGISGQAVYAAPIGGSAKVRQTMTLASPRTFTEVWARVRRASGTEPLFLTLRQGATTLGELQVPSASVPISAAGGDNGGSVWVGGTLPTPVVLTGACELRLSSASQYTAAPLRDGTDVGFSPAVCFPDGRMEVSSDNGTTWKDPYSGGILDLQCFLAP